MNRKKYQQTRDIDPKVDLMLGGQHCRHWGMSHVYWDWIMLLTLCT